MGRGHGGNADVDGMIILKGIGLEDTNMGWIQVAQDWDQRCAVVKTAVKLPRRPQMREDPDCPRSTRVYWSGLSAVTLAHFADLRSALTIPRWLSAEEWERAQAQGGQQQQEE
jgi:hypothetical protein